MKNTTQRLMQSLTLISYIIFDKSYVMRTKCVRELFSFHLHIIRENSVKCKKGLLKQIYNFIQICFLTRIHTHFVKNKCIHTHTHTYVRARTHTLSIFAQAHMHMKYWQCLIWTWVERYTAPVRCLVIANKK